MLALRVIRRLLLAAPLFFATLALASPRLEVTPGQVSVHAVSGQQVSATLSLRNTGDSPLDVSLQRGGHRALLLTTRSDLSEILPLLREIPEVGGVDVWDAALRTPDLAALKPYASVMTVFSYTRALDPERLGNVLADYVDQGGGVVLTLPSLLRGAEVRGRFLAEGYSPLNLGFGSIERISLGTFDATHPIMAGVRSLQGDEIAFTSPAAGATLVASWNPPQPLVATKGHVVAVNLFASPPGYSYGDVPRLLANALLWSARPVWLSFSPGQASLAPGEERQVTLTFDASGLEEGAYDVDVVVESNDPSNPALSVPAHMDVTGSPTVALGGGEQTLESSLDYIGYDGLTKHSFTLPLGLKSARVELVAEGFYSNQIGQWDNHTTLMVEGNVLGKVGPGPPGEGCQLWLDQWTLSGATLAAVAADGVLEATAQNSCLLLASCAVNRHTVRVRFDRLADRVEFAPLFVGRTRDVQFLVRNVGSALLHVTSIASSDPVFTLDRDTLTLRPHTEALLTVRFRPLVAGEANGTLVVTSDDPAAPLATIAAHGVGLVPPDIDVTPLAVAADLFTGASTRRTVTVRNLGGAPLQLRLQARSVPLDPDPLAVAAPISIPVAGGASLLEGSEESPGDGPPGLDPLTRPRSDEAQPTASWALPVQRLGGASVLLVLDAAPWGGLADQTVLGTFGVAFDLVRSTQLSSLDLRAYRLIIIGADQPPSTYATLRQQATRLDDFVRRGGTLEVHAAGWRFAAGDTAQWLLPGGMGVFQHLANANHVQLPSHPLVAGVPSPFQGTSASHASFTNVPPGASVVATDDAMSPNLVTYPLGLGLVIASGQALEYGFMTNQPAGRILRNMIPFAQAATPNWLSVTPAEAVVPPGGSLDATLTLDAARQSGGDRDGYLMLTSNDPDEAEVTVSARLHVTGAPDLRALGRERTLESRVAYSTRGATTTHRIEITPVPTGEVTFELEASGNYMDYDYSNEYCGLGRSATLEVEGRTLGSVGPMGWWDDYCITLRADFQLAARDAAPVVSDGVVEATVSNSADVGSGCRPDEHVVRVRYHESAQSSFADTYVGACDSSSFKIRNEGTEALVVSGITLDDAQFSVFPASLTLAPGEERDLQLLFCPAAVADFAATMTIASNDPDAAVTTVRLTGRGVTPPDLAVSPGRVHADVFAGDEVTRELELRNLGAEPLTYRIRQRSVSGTVTSAVAGPSVPAGAEPGRAYEADSVTSGTEPPSLDETRHGRLVEARPQSLRAALAPRLGISDVLLVQDVLPWGSDAEEALLVAAGARVDRIPAASFADTYLDGYRVIVVASDQPTSFYTTLNWQAMRLEAWVAAGGLLQAQVAGWGSNSGDASRLLLPGAVRAQRRLSLMNRVVSPKHPIMAGITPEFSGIAASYGFLVGLPPNAEILTQDPPGGATLAIYEAGAGIVVAGVQPYEYGFLNGQPAGQILLNMIMFALGFRPKWLFLEPAAGIVAAGSSATITLRLASAGLPAGDHVRDLEILSNDPDSPSLKVPVTLRVANVAATLTLDHRTLEPDQGGPWLKATLTLPDSRLTEDVDLASVMLNGVPVDRAQVAGEPGQDAADDRGEPGGREGSKAHPPKMMFRVERDAVLATFSGASPQTLNLSGLFRNGGCFLARDSVALRSGGDAQPSALAEGRPDVNAAAPLVPSFALAPNPVRSGSPLRLALALPRAGRIEAAVYSPAGRLVRTLASRSEPAGRVSLEWDGRDGGGRAVEPGVYLVRVLAPGLNATRRAVLLR